MGLNLPGGTPSFQPPPEPRRYVKPDYQGADTRAIRQVLQDEAARAEAHRQQVRADAEASQTRSSLAIRVATWTLVVSALTLLVAVATLVVTLI